jgi:alpha-L-rhamnosidase
MNSFNHYSLGSVGEWLYRHVAGIDQEPRSSGYKHIVIHPHPGGGLTSARAEYDSVRGRIASEWEVDDKFRLRVTIPANTTATVHVPAPNGAAITEGDYPLEQAEGVELLRLEDGETVVAVGSGRYEFVGSVR